MRRPRPPLPLDRLDFSGARRAPGLVGWAVLLAGVTACLAVLWEHEAVDQALASAERRLARETRQLERERAGRLAASRERLPADELARAVAVADELNRPWPNFFKDAETARSKDVALLSVEPQAAKGRLRVTGEARELRALFDYARALDAQPSFADSRVETYEFRKSGSVEVVAFTLSTRWLGVTR